MKKFIFLLLVLFSLSINAQELLYSVQKFTEEDGLPGRFIYDVIEDNDGLIWVATQDGIARFDGQAFRVFDKNNSNLESNEYRHFIKLKDGNILIAQPSSSAYFYEWKNYIDKNGKIQKIDSFNFPLISKLNKRLRIYDVNGQIYYMTPEGEVYFISDPPIKILDDKKYINKYIVNGDPLILANFETAHFFDENFEEQENENSNYSFPIVQNNKFYRINNLRWDLTKLEKVDRDGFSKKLFNKSNETIRNNISKIAYIGNISGSGFKVTQPYLIGENTLIFINEDGTSSDNLGKVICEKYGNNNFRRFEKTDNGNIWIWNKNGLFFVSKKKNLFKNHLSNRKFKSSTRSIMKNSKNELWVSCLRDGLLKFDYDKEEFFEQPYVSFDKSIFGIHEKKNGDVMLGGIYGNAHILSPTNKISKKILDGKLNLNNLPIIGDIVPFEDSYENLYLGSSFGLLFKRKSSSTEKAFNFIEETKDISITNFQEFDDGLWVSSRSGLLLIDPEQINLKVRYLPSFRIEHFYREGSVFWLATYGDGLVKWNREDNTISKYGKQHGLINEKLMAVYADKENNLWVSTNKGLARFNRKEETFRVFLETEGIAHNEFNFNSHFQDDDGRLFFGGLNGVTSFYPSKITSDAEVKYPMALIAFNLINRQTGKVVDKTQNARAKEKILIKSKDDYFEIEFALLNYINNRQSRYNYKIEGYHENWLTQKENKLRIKQLPYGDYTLKIKARDYRGVESKNILEIPLRITVPIYEKRWFQILCFLLVGAFSLFLIRSVLRKSETQKKELQEIVSHRTKELSTLNETKDRLFAILAHDLRNPVIAFESLSESLNYLIASNQIERVKELGDFIELEAKNLHHLLDNLLNWALSEREELLIKKEPLLIKSLVQNALKKYLVVEERMGVEITIEIPEDLKVLGDQRIIETVFRNIFSNAFRYVSKGDKVFIKAIQIEDQVSIDFGDTGKGMTKNELENLFKISQKFDSKGNASTISLGMHLCKELIELNNGTIKANSALEQGTVINIQLPISK